MYLQSSGLKIDQNTEDMRENSDRQKTISDGGFLLPAFQNTWE